MALKRKPNPSAIKNLPKTKDGKVKAGPGRKKGIPNKVTQEAKTAIALVYEGLGGVQGMLDWAMESKTNTMIFYKDIYTKLIPVQVQGKMDVNVRSDAERAAVDGLKSALLSVIAAQNERDARGDNATPVVIDASPNAEPDAVLVLSSSTGTKAA